MHAKLTSFILAGFILCFLPDVAQGCMCKGERSPCTFFGESPVVFVGLVTSVEEERVEIMRFGEKENRRIGLLAHFTIEEPLKGIDKKTADVVTGGGGGDCGYIFKAGERYLVYAYKTEAEAFSGTISNTVIGGRSRMTAPLTTTICSRTRPVSDAADDVDLIRALNAGKPETRVFGPGCSIRYQAGSFLLLT